MSREKSSQPYEGFVNEEEPGVNEKPNVITKEPKASPTPGGSFGEAVAGLASCLGSLNTSSTSSKCSEVELYVCLGTCAVCLLCGLCFMCYVYILDKEDEKTDADSDECMKDYSQTDADSHECKNDYRKTDESSQSKTAE